MQNLNLLGLNLKFLGLTVMLDLHLDLTTLADSCLGLAAMPSPNDLGLIVISN
jgi:hypothetical protein